MFHSSADGRRSQHVSCDEFIDLSLLSYAFYFPPGVGLSTFAILKLVNNHQLRNLRVSMYLERQRLVNEDNFRELTDPVRPSESSSE